MFRYMPKTITFAVILFSCLVSASSAQEEKSIDELMGLSIQKYLEGDNRQSIMYLDELLGRQPDHLKAKDLLEKTTRRFGEDIKVRNSYKEDMAFVEKARIHIPDSPVIKEIMKDFRQFMGIKDEPEPAPSKADAKAQPAPEPVQPAPPKPDPSSEYAAKEAEYRRQINALKSKLSRANKDLKDAESKKSEVSFDDSMIRAEIRNLEKKLAESEKPKAIQLLEESKIQAQSWQSFGQFISRRPSVEAALVDIAIAIHACRLMVYEAAWKADKGESIRHQTAMVKLFATEMLHNVADKVAHIFNGPAYVAGLPMERLCRNATAASTTDLALELQRSIIATDILKGLKV